MKQSYPQVGDLVVVTITEVKNFGAKANLEEYRGKEGFIHIAEVATGWVKRIRDYLREGQKTVCKVLNVDTSRGSIDLSLKRVNPHQKREKISEWKNEQKADKLLEIVAGSLGKSVDSCEKEFGFDLQAKYGTLYRAFEDAAADENWLPEVKGEWKEVFQKVAKDNVSIPYVKIGGYIEAYSLSSNGIERIKEVLGKVNSDAVKLQYAGAPRYRILVTEPDYKTAEETLKTTIKAMEDESKNLGVTFEFARNTSK